MSSQQLEITTEFRTDRGPNRDRNEDYALKFDLVTPSGLQLTALVVSDGAGGGDAGETASTTTTGAIEDYFKKSRETNVPDLMINAIRSANSRVIERLRGRGYSTVALVVIDRTHPEPVAYIASVGDSPIYLMRRGPDGEVRMGRLNIDHNVANDPLVRPERMDSRPDQLTRSIGGRIDVQVDIGRHVRAGVPLSPQEAEAAGREGFILKPHDTIFISSDGAFDPGGITTTGDNDAKIQSVEHERVLPENEILHHAQDRDVNRAAELLLKYALSRKPFDNVTIGLLFVDGPERRNAHELNVKRSPLIYLGGIAPLIIIALLAGLLLFRNQSNSEAEAKLTAQAGGTEAAYLLQTQAVPPTELPPLPSPTPLPTNTPVPTATQRPPAQPNEVGQSFTGGSSQASSIVQENSIVNASAPSRLMLDGGSQLAASDIAQVILDTSSSVKIVQVDNQRSKVEVNLMPAAQTNVFIVGGMYNVSAALESNKNIVLGLQASTSGIPACFGTKIIGTQLNFDCLGDTCAYSDKPLTANNRVSLDTTSLSVLSTNPLTADDALMYWRLAQATGVTDLPGCMRTLLDTDADTFVDQDEPAVCRNDPGTDRGCSDKDNDKVPLDQDQCPSQAGPISNKGCPLDSDKDGTFDNMDRCPRERGPKSTNGCPVDSDRDGVLDPVMPDSPTDGEDFCPSIFGSAANKGCPIATPTAIPPTEPPTPTPCRVGSPSSC